MYADTVTDIFYGRNGYFVDFSGCFHLRSSIRNGWIVADGKNAQRFVFGEMLRYVGSPLLKFVQSYKFGFKGQILSDEVVGLLQDERFFVDRKRAPIFNICGFSVLSFNRIQIWRDEPHRFMDDVAGAVDAHIVVTQVPINCALDSITVVYRSFNRTFMNHLIVLHPDVFDRRGSLFPLSFLYRWLCRLAGRRSFDQARSPTRFLFDTRHYPSVKLSLVTVGHVDKFGHTFSYQFIVRITRSSRKEDPSFSPCARIET